ncbi:MAG: hypothetical protein KDD37_09230, partial [Bdellovibrionales bacterium]|nr:hypothetical protein [Bdellovibrionales bacterium]
KNLKSTKLLEESEAAVAPDASLSKTRSGIPYYESAKLKTVKNLPLLDIGKERVVSASNWELPELRAALARRQDINQLKSPDMVSDFQFLSWLDVHIDKVEYQPIKIVTAKSLGLTEKSIADLKWYTRQEVEVSLLAMDRLSKDEYTLIKGLMLELAKNCHSASGIFYSLSGSENIVVDKTAKYNLATCSHKMGLFHQSVPRLLAVVSSNFSPEAKSVALETLLKDVPYEHEIEVGEGLNKKEILAQVPDKLKDTYHYVVMKSHLRQHQFKSALNEALKVPESSKFFVKSQYGAAIAEYSLGDLKGSLQRQKELKAHMKKEGVSDKNIYSLVNINLARYGFQQKQLNLAISNYREIDRSHPLWIESLEEQGWAQLSNGDEPGAIGNMHSLHSPYFKGVYMPETYSIRTIGYLNLCHYGDAYKSLMTLEQTYGPIKNSIGSYLKGHSNSKTYATIYSYLKQRQKEVDGLPEPVIRDVARRKDFLNMQEHINAIVDEIDQMSFVDNLVLKEKSKAAGLKGRAQSTIKELEKKIKQADVKPDLKKYKGIWQTQLEEQHDKLAGYDFKLEVFEESREGFKKFRGVAVSKLTELGKDLRTKAGGKIKDHLAKLEKDLKGLFKNNEFLRYEVFAGSGQNIRFQAAGGQAEDKRLPSSAIPKGKDFKWSFDGEFWEDEVGYYRSSLKSNCPER